MIFLFPRIPSTSYLVLNIAARWIEVLAGCIFLPLQYEVLAYRLKLFLSPYYIHIWTLTISSFLSITLAKTRILCSYMFGTLDLHDDYAVSLLLRSTRQRYRRSYECQLEVSIHLYSLNLGISESTKDLVTRKLLKTMQRIKS